MSSSLVWSVVEALALVCIIAGGFMLWGAWALIVGGVLIVALSFLVNRKVGDGS